MPDLFYENLAHEQGYSLVCGVDEAGRGPLAGPVCAAAVILDPNRPIEGLNDSKKLSPKKRELLFDEIRKKALAFSVAFADVEEIEEFNILEATFLAMNRAISGLEPAADFAVIDGNKIPRGIAVPARAVVKGDGKSASVAAASILAKVTRDRLMEEMDKKYPCVRIQQTQGLRHKGTYRAYKKIRSLRNTQEILPEKYMR